MGRISFWKAYRNLTLTTLTLAVPSSYLNKIIFQVRIGHRDRIDDDIMLCKNRVDQAGFIQMVKKGMVPSGFTV